MLNERQFMYHHSPAENRDSIRTEGLRVSDPYDPNAHGEDRSLAPRGVYLAEHGDEMEHHTRFGSDVWKVDVHGLALNEDPDDPNREYGFHYSPHHIGPERVRLFAQAKKR